MLARKHRFHGLGSLKSVFKYGQNIKGPLISLRHNLNPHRKEYRCAVVVSRKVHRSAVVRNRIRRRVYEDVRGIESQISRPYDLVFTIHSDQLAKMEAAKLRSQIQDLLSRAKILTTPKAGHDMIVPKET